MTLGIENGIAIFLTTTGVGLMVYLILRGCAEIAKHKGKDSGTQEEK